MKFPKLKNLFQRGKKENVRADKNKMLVLRKKQVVAASLLILIGIAGYLNWTFRNDAVDPDVAVMYQEASKKIGEAKMVNAEASSEPQAAETIQPKDDSTQPSTGNNYFAQAKLEREVKRSESMEMLTQLIETQGTDKEAKTNAENEIQRMADYTEKETTMENLIRAKGFDETVVFMSAEMVSVAVESDGLNEIDAAQIRDVVISCCGYGADQIKIVEIDE